MQESNVRNSFIWLKSMKNNKTPGNSGLTKKNHETFWDELKIPLLGSINQAFYTKIFCFNKGKVSCNQAHWEERLINNTLKRLISLLNVDTKILSKKLF